MCSSFEPMYIDSKGYVPRAAVKLGEMSSIICKALEKAFLEKVELLHELHWDKFCFVRGIIREIKCHNFSDGHKFHKQQRGPVCWWSHGQKQLIHCHRQGFCFSKSGQENLFPNLVREEGELSPKAGKTYFQKVARFLVYVPQGPGSNWQNYILIFINLLNTFRRR